MSMNKLVQITILFILDVILTSQALNDQLIYITHGSEGNYVNVDTFGKLTVSSDNPLMVFAKRESKLRDANGNNCVSAKSNGDLEMAECAAAHSFEYISNKLTYQDLSDNSCWAKHTGGKIQLRSCWTESGQFGFYEHLFNGTRTSVMPKEASSISSYKSHALPTTSLLPPVAMTSAVSLDHTMRATPSSTVMLSSSFYGGTKLHASEMYLADPGEQCQTFCSKKNLYCSTSIETGNSYKAFTDNGVSCMDTETKKYWKHDYDPSFYVNTSTCAGYMSVNDSAIKCFAEGFQDTNVRRLCRCLISGNEESFGPWTPWSQCSKSCDKGMQTRKRVCTETTCIGSTIDGRDCNVHPCPVNGGFSEWSLWSPCTVTCGGGERIQTRTCTNPRPEHGGYYCFGIDSKKDACNSHFCPVHGNWTEWTQWSACDKPCNNGTIRRWRYCTNPTPLYGGSYCSGDGVDALPCNSRECPAESITVLDLRFDYQWNANMATSGSEAFNQFANEINLNIQRVYNYSDVQPTYKGSTVSYLSKGSVVATFTLYFTGMDSFQVLLLQSAIEDDKYLGKLKIMGFNDTYNTEIVPSSSPINFTITPLSTTSIKAEWLTIPPEHRHGNISGYILFYKEKQLRSAPFQSIATDALNVNLYGLKIYTEYAFRVLAYNENGNGMATAAKYVFTQESTPSQPPHNISAISSTGFTVIIEWFHIPQEEWNGVPLGTLIKLHDRNGNERNKTVSYPLTFAVLENLIPITTYIIDVCEMTSPGPGPCQRVQVTTLPAPPSRYPMNIKIEPKAWHDRIQLTWDSIPTSYVHGDLHGYKIFYKLIKIAGKSVVQSETMLKIIHPSITNATITGLQTNAQYAFQISGYNEYGDGEASPVYYGDTCSCPPVIYTNFAASDPYIYRDALGNRKGLFVDILDRVTKYTCNLCNRPTNTTIDYVSNGKNGVAEKRSLKQMKMDIDDYIGISFPVFGSTEMTQYYGYAFVPVFNHPGVVYYIIKDSIADIVQKMLGNVLRTWPIFLINLLLIAISGYIIWALERRQTQSDFPPNCYSGVLNGMYWAYITMGTHGYGDLTPKGNASRVFTIAWILVGMINLAIFTGALTTAITAAQVYNDPKMYGIEVAAIHDSAAHRIAILRNAKVNTKATYNTIEEVASALQNRQVRGVLVDVFAAATRSDLFLQSDIMVKKRIQYPSAYGFVLSGDMANAAPEFRNYLSGQANSILKFMEEKASGLEVNVDSGETVSMFDRESPVLQHSLIAISALLAFLLTTGVVIDYLKKQENRKLTMQTEGKDAKDIMKLCDDSLTELEESIAGRIQKMTDLHLNARVDRLYKEKRKLDKIPFFRCRNLEKKKDPYHKAVPLHLLPGPSRLTDQLDGQNSHIVTNVSEVSGQSRAIPSLKIRASFHSLGGQSCESQLVNVC